MATFTAAEIKTRTSVSTVEGWSDDKILLIQASAEAILSGLDMDTTLTGYADAYNAAVIHLFDWIADNPTMLKSGGRGKVSKQYSEVLPGPVQAILKKYMDGSYGNLAPMKFKRRDFGLR